jgi:membrane protein
VLRRTVMASLDHDALLIAQAAAYSAMVALFPALIVVAAIIAVLPLPLPVRYQLAGFFNHVLPSNVVPLFEGYFATTHHGPRTTGALLGSILVSLSGASSVMVTLMEGFRRAHDLPDKPGTFWRRRKRALTLVPLSLVPMSAASALVVFGHLMTRWVAAYIPSVLRPDFYLLTVAIRWSIALLGSVGIIAVIYHLGTDVSRGVRGQIEPVVREPWVMLRPDWSWRASLPGATLATLLWFVSTLVFGLYVTRFANYTRVYGSLGAAIALMFWLYIIALSVLIGSEFNAQRAFLRLTTEARAKERAAALWNAAPRTHSS